MIRHFEYRYSAYEDELDAIGPDGNYDGTTTDPEIIAKIGTTDAEKSAYLRKVYANLEKVFNWLDSTDQNSATGNNLAEPHPIWKTNKAYTGEGETSVPEYTYNQVPSTSAFDEATQYYIKGENNTYEPVEITEFAPGVVYFTSSILYYWTTFANDTKGYRLEKFRNELEEHFDKEYCLVYYILTELLLCYDSRGKNLMMSS